MVSWGLRGVLIFGLVQVLLCPFTKVEESFNTQASHDILFHFLGVDEAALGHSPAFPNGSLALVWRVGSGQLKVDFDDALSKFDHNEFSGVVPRTFTGAWAVSLLSWPLLTVGCALPLSGALEAVASGLRRWLGASTPSTPLRHAFLSSIECAAHNPGCAALVCVRMVLTACTWMCLVSLGSALGRRFGRDCEKWFGVVCLCQFHLVFYLGRPLPNTFALGLASLGLASWISGKWRSTINRLALCTLVFRCDTVLLCAPIGLMMLAYSREAGFFPLAGQGVLASLGALALTAGPDSVMWGRPLWPEGAVHFFNTVLNKSSEWGVMPWHWYVSSALPRALLASLPLALLGALQPLTRLGARVLDRDACAYLLFPAVSYVCVYSILPHKEVRFLFQVLPFFNALAALGVAKLERAALNVANKKKQDDDVPSRNGTRLARLARLAAMLGLAGACAGFTASWLVAQLFFAVSAQNYPGAHALLQLQRHHAKRGELDEASPMQAHFCVLAAMTGISRFLEHGTLGLEYSKREDVTFQQQLCVSHDFDYLIMEVERFNADPACRKHYRVVSEQFGAPNLNYGQARIDIAPVLYVLERTSSGG